MAISYIDLFKLLKSNVIEIQFVRRNKATWTNVTTRRMLCTLSDYLLYSPFGKVTLNFKKPKNDPPYSAPSKGLITVWDIMMQEWRNIPVDSVKLVNSIPERDFINYFDKKIKNMSASEKQTFMLI